MSGEEDPRQRSSRSKDPQAGADPEHSGKSKASVAGTEGAEGAESVRRLGSGA